MVGTIKEKEHYIIDLTFIGSTIDKLIIFIRRLLINSSTASK